MRLTSIFTILLAALFAMNASAQITLYEQFLGKYDFVTIGNTMNEFPNGANAYCDFLTSTSADLNLTPDQTIEAAYLYWAGSGDLNVADLDILLNGNPVTVDRTFSIDITGKPVYGAFSDITSFVQTTGNATYTVSEFDLSSVITNAYDYCDNGVNFGGWAIMIIYQDDSLTNNLVNVYDGFSRVDTNNQTLTIQLDDLNVLHLVGNKIGFLAWEGDQNISVSEQLRINGNVVSNPPLNPADNAFNGTNSFTNSNTLYNMDIDYYDINSYTDIGDNSLQVQLNSGQDAVIINNMVVVLNTEVPDATIEVEPVIGSCDERDIEFDYTVSNLIATQILPAGTPIAFFANDTLIGTSVTQNDIPIGGSEDNSIILTIPDEIPYQFILKVKVDDDGLGNGTVYEFNEDNNVDEQEIQLRFTPELFEAEDLILCDTNNDGSETFDLTVPGNQILNGQEFVNINYYATLADAEDENSNITTPESYNNITPTQTIYVRLDDGQGCYIIGNFQIQIIPPSDLTYQIPELKLCLDSNSETGNSVDLTVHEDLIYNGNNPADYNLSYHLTENNAKSGVAPIADPTAFSNTSNPQTIWVRLVDNEGCVQTGSFILRVVLNPQIINAVFTNCSLDDFSTYYLPDINDEISNVTTGLTFSYHLTEQEAEDSENPLPDEYENTTADQIIFVRVENSEGCFSIAEVILDTILIQETVANALQVCDNPEMINDQTAYFDLTSMDNEVENALGGNGYTFTYHTSIEEAQSGINPISEPTNYQNTSNPQMIYVRASDSENGCAGTVEFAIEVLPVPEFNLPEYIAFCDNDEKTFEFEENYSSYTWLDSNGNEISNSIFVEFPAEGIYTLEVRDLTVNDCPASREIEVIFDHSPIITDIKIDGNLVTVFANGGDGPYQYSYNNGLTWHEYYILDDVPAGIFDMIVKSRYGCVSDPKTFGVLGIPNVITPNGDGYNDVWEIRALEMYPEAYIKIFDRYGKIFVDRPMGENFKWDGTYQGRPLPSADYWYIITIKDKSISGHLTIRNRD